MSGARRLSVTLVTTSDDVSLSNPLLDNKQLLFAPALSFWDTFAVGNVTFLSFNSLGLQ